MRWSITSFLLLCSGCTNVFLQPDRRLHARPEQVGAVWEEARFRSADGTGLTGLWMPARNRPAKAVVVHFHGNAENMTSHFLNVYWLALEGYDVLAFDYRGFGASEGVKSVSGAVADGVAALAYARSKARGLPLIVFGQSFGGAAALASLDADGGEGLKALVLESTYASFRGIARDKLKSSWLTRPLRWPLSLLISDDFKPSRLAARRKPVPLLMLHAQDDPVVPYAQGRLLYMAAAGPKEWWEVPAPGHAEAFTKHGPLFRPKLLEFFDRGTVPDLR